MATAFKGPAAACVLLVLLALSQASAGTAKPQLSVPQSVCPGIVECIQPGLDVLVALDVLQTRHVSRVTDISACQSFCNTTRHTYYRFTPRVAPKKSLCHCFEGCVALVASKTSVGLVSACQAKPVAAVQLKAQQAGELAASDSKKAATTKESPVPKSIGAKAKKAVALEQVVLVEEVKELEGRKMAAGFTQENLREQQRLLLEHEEEME